MLLLKLLEKENKNHPLLLGVPGGGMMMQPGSGDATHTRGAGKVAIIVFATFIRDPNASDGHLGLSE